MVVERNSTKESPFEGKEWSQGDVVAVTVAPSDEEQYFTLLNEPEERLKEFVKHFCNLLKLACKGCEGTFYFEANKVGRLHLHGWLKITDVKMFYMTTLIGLKDCHVGVDVLGGKYRLDYVGNYRKVDFKTAVDLEKWKLYCTKMGGIFGHVNVPLPEPPKKKKRKLKKRRLVSSRDESRGDAEGVDFPL